MNRTLGRLRSVIDGTNTTRSAPKRCLGCGRDVDAHSGDPGTSPKPGDVSICAYCARAMQYGPELELEPLDMSELPEDVRAEVEEGQALIRAAMLRSTRRRGES